MRKVPLFALVSLAVLLLGAPACRGVDPGLEAQNLSIRATPVVEPLVPPTVDASYAAQPTTWPGQVSWNDFPEAAKGTPAPAEPPMGEPPAGALPPAGGAAAAAPPAAPPPPPLPAEDAR